MNVLIIGSGGREHALGWKLRQSPGLAKLYFAPGNGGTEDLGENVPISVEEIEKLADFAQAHDCLTVVGPEVSLSLGVVDVFRERGLLIFGPDKRGAALECSKSYAKAFMHKYNIPTAAYGVFDEAEAALKALADWSYPVVVKADGLAAGKGVSICANENEARIAILSMMKEQVFGAAGSRIVLEEFLTGREVSLICFTDGLSIVPMETASDYKRAKDNDEGPNTGGMGVISPSPFYTKGAADDIVQKTLAGIQAEKFDFRGIVYIGLMMTADGPKVLEYNARFGDPETEVLMPRLDTDLLDIIQAVLGKRLADVAVQWKAETAVSVVLASEGYPGAYETGHVIEAKAPDAVLFHMGTRKQDGLLKTSGGRVLAVTGLGADNETARRQAYAAVEQISFKNKFYRRDIGRLTC